MYDMTPDQERLSGLPGAEWGTFTRYLEVGPDRYATRQVDMFANGHALRYDRDHYIDEFGTLADLRYSSKWTRWWPNSRAIDAAEFERVWVAAGSSVAATLQAQSTMRASWPGLPPWLRETVGDA